jgi:RNA polymerase sigma-70 factor (ECF subfamily)
MLISDNEIIEKIRKGGKHHYARLIDRYKDKAFTLAVRMLKDRQEAEEAIQDAFIRAYNALDKFQGTAKFGTWFYRIVYNVCLTRLGKRKAEFIFMEYEEESGNGSMTHTVAESLEKQIEAGNMIEFVKKIIETLPEKYGMILSLFYLQELTHEEICEVTQLPLGTVKVHLFRARAMLQERLTSEFLLTEGVKV